jgi:hypothetical protein
VNERGPCTKRIVVVLLRHTVIIIWPTFERPGFNQKPTNRVKFVIVAFDGPPHTTSTITTNLGRHDDRNHNVDNRCSLVTKKVRGNAPRYAEKTRMSNPSKYVPEEPQRRAVRTSFEMTVEGCRAEAEQPPTTTMDQQETAGKTHSRDGLCRIKTAPTEDSAADDIETTRHFTGTPVRNSDEYFTTPSKQNIKVSYEMLGLSNQDATDVGRS